MKEQCKDCGATGVELRLHKGTPDLICKRCDTVRKTEARHTAKGRGRGSYEGLHDNGPSHAEILRARVQDERFNAETDRILRRITDSVRPVIR